MDWFPRLRAISLVSGDGGFGFDAFNFGSGLGSGGGMMDMLMSSNSGASSGDMMSSDGGVSSGAAPPHLLTSQLSSGSLVST